jgi:hypothetical protein
MRCAAIGVLLSSVALAATAPRFDLRSPRPEPSRRAARAQDSLPSFDTLLAHRVRLKPALVGVHPRVFVTAAELPALRTRAKTTHREEWQRALAALVSLTREPAPPPGSQERRAQNDVALQIAGTSLAFAIEQDPKYLTAAKRWTLAAVDYEPWGYTFNKPNTDLAAGHRVTPISSTRRSRRPSTMLRAR